MDVEGLRAELAENGQEHLLQHWNSLTEQEQQILYDDLKSIDYPKLNIYFQNCTKSHSNGVNGKVDDHLDPIPPAALGSITRTEKDVLQGYEDEGVRQVSESAVAVLLLAGGQGTRLGVPYPKGMYNVGLPSGKSLYQLQAERIRRLQEISEKKHGTKGAVIPWYIMTSEHTMDSTRNFFKKHNYFGLDGANIVFFEQHMLPCMTLEGKIMLQTTHKVARAPDGNGGLYRALSDANILNDMLSRDVKYLHVYCVDNILVKMADPVFIGFCISKNAYCGAKVVEKAFATEALGVVCKVDSIYQVVEYSEITLNTAEKRTPEGKLVFNAGNICNHFFSVDFLKNVVKEREDELIHHMAKKKIPTCNDLGETVTPSKPNGIKMEKFVFDVFKFADTLAVWEVLREDEFSPLKNADGAPKDTPTTCRHDMLNLCQRMVIKAGGKFIRDDKTVIPDIPSETDKHNGDSESSHHDDQEHQQVVCEVSPLLSYGGEGLEFIVKGNKFMPPLVLRSPSETETESAMD